MRMSLNKFNFPFEFSNEFRCFIIKGYFGMVYFLVFNILDYTLNLEFAYRNSKLIILSIEFLRNKNIRRRTKEMGIFETVKSADKLLFLFIEYLNQRRGSVPTNSKFVFTH